MCSKYKKNNSTDAKKLKLSSQTIRSNNTFVQQNNRIAHMINNYHLINNLQQGDMNNVKILPKFSLRSKQQIRQDKRKKIRMKTQYEQIPSDITQMKQTINEFKLNLKDKNKYLKELKQKLEKKYLLINNYNTITKSFLEPQPQIEDPFPEEQQQKNNIDLYNLTQQIQIRKPQIKIQKLNQHNQNSVIIKKNKSSDEKNNKKQSETIKQKFKVIRQRLNKILKQEQIQKKVNQQITSYNKLYNLLPKQNQVRANILIQNRWNKVIEDLFKSHRIQNYKTQFFEQYLENPKKDQTIKQQQQSNLQQKIKRITKNHCNIKEEVISIPILKFRRINNKNIRSRTQNYQPNEV